MTIASLTFISYAAMPPRTILSKNAILTDARRNSVSYNTTTVDTTNVASSQYNTSQYNQNVV